MSQIGFPILQLLSKLVSTSLLLVVGLGNESLSKSTGSLLSEITSQMHSAGSGLFKMIATDFACQICNGQFYAINGILIAFLMIVMVHFLRNCVIMAFFFIWISSKGFRDVKKKLLVVFCRFLEQLLVKDALFPVVRNGLVSHQFGHNRNATRVSLNYNEVTQGFF